MLNTPDKIQGDIMLAQHKGKIISTLAAAFLAAFAVFYDTVVEFVTVNYVNYTTEESTTVDPQITDSVTSTAPSE
jgi:hypothetical protein